MKVYLVGENAFIELPEGILLYISTAAEAEKATQTELIKLINAAITRRFLENLDPGKMHKA